MRRAGNREGLGREGSTSNDQKIGLGDIDATFRRAIRPSGCGCGTPLNADDVTLLLLGGSPSPKIVTLVKQRGVSFKMNPDLAKKFHDAGASDDLIDALTDAGLKAQPSSSSPTHGPTAPESGRNDTFARF